MIIWKYLLYLLSLWNISQIFFSKLLKCLQKQIERCYHVHNKCISQQIIVELQRIINYYLFDKIQSMPAVVIKNKNAEENLCNKFQLTELQKEYLQLFLPRSIGLRLTDLTDEKRNRTPKKTEEIYDTEFFNEGNRHSGNANSSQPKNEKKNSTKEKEKLKAKTSEQKNIKISSEKRDEEKKKIEARRGRPCKENPIKKQFI